MNPSIVLFCRLPRLVGILLLVSTACFTGAGLAGFPCSKEQDCGPKFTCQQGVCVDPKMKFASSSSGNGSSSSSGDVSSETSGDSSSTSEASCGDGQVQAGEQCDPGPEENSECDEDCTLRECGDEVINEAANEQCEGDAPILRGICDSKNCSIDCIGLSWRNCNQTGKDGCEANILIDPANCGGCGNICGADFECIQGDCL